MFLKLEGLKVAWPVWRKLNLEVEPGISDGHRRFWTTTHKLKMATINKQSKYESKFILDLVELFNPNTRTSCVITGKLDQPRIRHTGDGNLVCGSYGNDGNDYKSISSCYNVATGATINLLNGRSHHTSWSTDAGIYLLGGLGTGTTTELVTGDTTQAGFGLQYSTR